MPRRKEEQKFVAVGSKDIWDPVGLQGLATSRFGDVCTLILSGRHAILSFASRGPIKQTR